jgi:putative oligomerization/nucleic acid binding protein
VFSARRMMRRRGRAAGLPDQTQAPPPEAPVDPLEQIKELAELREQGILTEEEFAAEKKRLLGD